MSSGGTRTSTISDPIGISANQTTVFDIETVRGNLGYAADNILFYATGGLAWSNDQFVRTQLTGTLNAATAGTDEAVNQGLPGWTAGGGIAYAFAQNWSVFAEYRHIELCDIVGLAAVLTIDDYFDKQCERAAVRCEL